MGKECWVLGRLGKEKDGMRQETFAGLILILLLITVPLVVFYQTIAKENVPQERRQRRIALIEENSCPYPYHEFKRMEGVNFMKNVPLPNYLFDANYIPTEEESDQLYLGCDIGI